MGTTEGYGWNLPENISKDPLGNNTFGDSFQKTFIEAGLLPDVIILFSIAVTGAFGNGVVLCYNLFFKGFTSLQPLEVLVLNSAVADFLLCILYIPWQIAAIFAQEWRFEGVLCTTSNLLLFQFMTVSVGTHLCISAYCLLKCVLRPRASFSALQMSLWSVALWGYNAIVAITSVTAGNVHFVFDDVYYYRCLPVLSEPQRFKAFGAILILSVYLPLLLTGVNYAILFARIHTRERHPWEGGRAVKVLVALFGLFLIFWLPATIHSIVDSELEAPPMVMRSLVYLTFSITTANPIFYAYRFQSIIPDSFLVRCRVFKESIFQLFIQSPKNINTNFDPDQTLVNLRLIGQQGGCVEPWCMYGQLQTHMIRCLLMKNVVLSRQHCVFQSEPLFEPQAVVPNATLDIIHADTIV